MNVKSYAKINLALSIGRKNSKGYHEISSVMQQVELCDELVVTKIAEDKILVRCNVKELESERNVAYKAADLLRKRFNIKEGIQIEIKKNIPLAAGLAGGSGNAAAALKAINELFLLCLSPEQLVSLGAKIGSDVPFQIVGGTCLVEGSGEKVKRLKDLSGLDIVIVNPGIEVSTKWAYNEFDRSKTLKAGSRVDDILLGRIYAGDVKGIAKSLFNDFEPVVLGKYPELKKIKEELISNCALNALLSGSGSSVFGLFGSGEQAKAACNALNGSYPMVVHAKAV